MTAKEKAERAKRILEDEVFAEAVALTKEGIVRDWEQAQSTELRERLHGAMKEVNRLQASLRILAEQVRDRD